MSIVWTLIIGLIAGALAKLLMPGRQGGGIIVTMLLGAGAFLAGFLGQALGWYRTPGEGPGIIASTLGALVVLAVYGLLKRDRPAGRTP
jgi:uncharacterized membrane protein YeaQ/YmgE (transglycosylase-associated protein family)